MCAPRPHLRVLAGLTEVPVPAVLGPDQPLAVQPDTGAAGPPPALQGLGGHWARGAGGRGGAQHRAGGDQVRKLVIRSTVLEERCLVTYQLAFSRIL